MIPIGIIISGILMCTTIIIIYIAKYNNKTNYTNKCLPGYTSEEGSSICKRICNNGSIYNTTTKVCNECPIGSYQSVNDCILCTDKCKTSNKGSTSCNVNICSTAGIPCPSNSTTTPNSNPIPNYTGCYCLDNTIWNGSYRVCPDSPCPPWTSTSFSGDPITDKINCKCPNNFYWKNDGCRACPPYSEIGTGRQPIDTSRFGNCACDLSHTLWNESQQACVA